MSAELLIKIEKLEAALRLAARNDNSSYRLRQKRFFDNKAPGDAKIWDTPRDIARKALGEPNLASVFDPEFDWDNL